METKQENDKPVSTWQTFFERNIRLPDPALGLDGPSAPVEISFGGKSTRPRQVCRRVKLAGKVWTTRGSYLMTFDGSPAASDQPACQSDQDSPSWSKEKTANSLSLLQTDGAAWDGFSIEGANRMMSFDAGEIEMTADGEKTHSEKAAEPPDL